ncbi:hypothetical protein DFH06DRAFT_1249817 [Mycena polygramma]|nr:hypothetical protein DFH06DRAFT_1249817 [Mycena polygramma]
MLQACCSRRRRRPQAAASLLPLFYLGHRHHVRLNFHRPRRYLQNPDHSTIYIDIKIVAYLPILSSEKLGWWPVMPSFTHPLQSASVSVAESVVSNIQAIKCRTLRRRQAYGEMETTAPSPSLRPRLFSFVVEAPWLPTYLAHPHRTLMSSGYTQCTKTGS